jgi:hypothetical protein
VARDFCNRFPLIRLSLVMGMSLRVANAFSRLSATSHANPRDKRRLTLEAQTAVASFFGRGEAHDTDILGE